MVQAPQHHSLIERHAACIVVRRPDRTTFPGLDFFQPEISAQGEADRAAAHELCGRDQLDAARRQGWIKLAKGNYNTKAGVFFDVPLEVCLQRNQRRERTVSEDVMRRMSGNFRPPTFEEGFSKITVVRVKQKV